jgi:hypothetical protein
LASPAGVSGNTAVATKSGSKFSTAPSKGAVNKDDKLSFKTRPSPNTKLRDDLASKRKSDGFVISKANTTNRNYTTTKKDGEEINGRNRDLNTTRKVHDKESHVYVHVVDSIDSKADSSKQQVPSSRTASSRTQTEKSAIAPLAARFGGSTVSKAFVSKAGGGLKGKTDPPYSSRLYPHQSGHVASLVSTLNKSKDTKNGDAVSREHSTIKTKVT